MKKKKKKVYTSLRILTLGSIIVIMLGFGLVVGLIGAYAFTASFYAEYREYVGRIAKYSQAQVSLDKSSAEGALNYTREELMESFDILMSMTKSSEIEEFLNSKPDPDYSNTVMDYVFTVKNLYSICENTGMSDIYIVKPDPDFQHYKTLVNCPSSETSYSPWPIGHVETTRPEYIVAYDNIYNKKSELEIVNRYTDIGSDKPHVTALVPLKDEDGTIFAVLCVQRYTEEMVNTRRNFGQGVGAMTIIVIIIILLMESRLLQTQVIDPVDKIAREANRFASNVDGKHDLISGDLDDDICRVKEIVSLAESIKKMETDTITGVSRITNMTREKERVDADLNVARQIQIGLLPQDDNSLEEQSGFGVSASMRPAREVGGDFYDYFMVDDTHLAILIADVSDKGVGAAFFMAISKTLIKASSKISGTASEIIQFAESLISESNTQGMFVTVWFAIIDLETGNVNACNAGHDYPAIMKNGGDYVIEKTPHGPPVCFLPGVQHVEYSFNMEEGDRIFLYTDGVNEAKRSDGERFGTERLLEVLNENKSATDEELIEKMTIAVDRFVGTEAQFDDMTMLSFTFNHRHVDE